MNVLDRLKLDSVAAPKATRKVKAIRRAAEELIGLTPDKWLKAPETLCRNLYEKYYK